MLKRITFIALAISAILARGSACAAEFHVAPTGNNANPGTATNPLKTIQAAADNAQPGDTVTVHAGVYRERVNPPRGGTSDTCRITYQAAAGEKVVITGSEPVKGWERVSGDVWKVVLPNSTFAGFNPFADKVQGEWCSPTGRHAGSVYLNGEWLAESLSLEAVMKWREPLWFAQVEPDTTTLWAQFPGVNPNEAEVEISKRQCVFYPSRTGVNYITVRGFELCRAATPWAGAMSEQVGLVGTHWSKGWIIENNHIHHSMCTGVTLGRYELPKGEMPPATAPGFVKSIELALRDGWSKDKVGSHIVRNNHIHHCEKNAIHGSLGAVFSEISGTEIHDIAVRNWVRGPDTAGIKFLGGVDMVIRDNHIYRCAGEGGIWLDWMCQGSIVTGNLLHDNRLEDIFFEMQHGPLLFANNLLLSSQAMALNSKGLALAHNLIAGRINHFTKDEKPPRQTPFHPAHAVTIAGLHSAGTGDHRLYNNLFVNGWNGHALNVSARPCFAAGNVFVGAARPFKFDPAPVLAPQFNPQFKLTQKPDGWYFTLNADPAWRTSAKCQPVTTGLLGNAKIPNLPYENTDGSPLKLDTDYFGKLRDPQNPFPGPFETVKEGAQEIKVWPKNDQTGAQR
jgi:alpha-N-arabinofuranosidase